MNSNWDSNAKIIVIWYMYKLLLFIFVCFLLIAFIFPQETKHDHTYLSPFIAPSSARIRTTINKNETITNNNIPMEREQNISTKISPGFICEKPLETAWPSGENDGKLWSIWTVQKCLSPFVPNGVLNYLRNRHITTYWLKIVKYPINVLSISLYFNTSKLFRQC